MVEEQAQQSTGTSSLEKAAAGGLTAAPLVDDALSTASEGASAAGVLSVTAFSPAGCVSKKMPVPAGTAIRGGGETEAGAPQTVQVHDRRNLAVPLRRAEGPLAENSKMGALAGRRYFKTAAGSLAAA